MNVQTGEGFQLSVYSSQEGWTVCGMGNNWEYRMEAPQANQFF
jgi:hypothetical protein